MTTERKWEENGDLAGKKATTQVNRHPGASSPDVPNIAAQVAAEGRRQAVEGLMSNTQIKGLTGV